MEQYALIDEVGAGLLPSDEIRMLHALTDELAAQPALSGRMQRLLQLTLEQFCAASGSIVVLNKCGQVVEGALAFDGQVQPSSLIPLATRVGCAGLGKPKASCAQPLVCR